jgi:CDP-glycerol glycerophosphotransferase
MARVFLRIFYIFPIKKDRIIFISYWGSQYACNQKYIFEYMINNYKTKYEYIWCINDPNKFSGSFVCKTVKHLSLEYIFYILTAKYIINNCGIEPMLPIRNEQTVINTWHGAAYKEMGGGGVIYRKHRFSTKIMAKLRSGMTKYVISPYKKFTEDFSLIWLIPERKFLNIGYPRNDIFFSDTKVYKQKVYSYYNFDNSKKLVLFAPTFRGDHHCPERYENMPNVKLLLSALKQKFDTDFIFLYRLHHLSHGYFRNSISVADYPDMQELLCAIDILITDYSSSMWDFSYTYKPCFLYTPDIEEYKSAIGLSVPIEEWPFSFSTTDEQLVRNIHDYDEQKYCQAIKQHHIDMGSYEAGTARERFCQIVFK